MKDLLIVGFGLAGLSVANHAERYSLRFDIISDKSQLSSSIAGGILNPIAIKRMKPVWLVNTYLPYAIDFYQQLQAYYQTTIIKQNNIHAFLHHTEQENEWYAAYDSLVSKSYMIKKIQENQNNYLQIQKLGIIKANKVELQALIATTKNQYIHQDQFIEQTFCHKDMIIHKDRVTYQDKNYKHIIFCEGYGVVHNPFFNNIGIYGNKGDYIIIRSKELALFEIHKAKYFLIPLGNNLYKFGATYQKEPLNHLPSTKAKVNLKEALHKMTTATFEIVDQLSGIRPTTLDRRPILGTHYQHNNLHIVNGFGSRGVMIAPLLGKKIIEHIFHHKKIEAEISVERQYTT